MPLYPAPVMVLDEDTMASNSATAVPSQQSTKAYVDNTSVLLSNSRSKILRIVGTGNMTTTSTTFVAMDVTDLAWQPLTGLVTGQWVRLKLIASISHGTSAEAIYFDFEVDRPTSADTRTGNDVEGVGRHTASGASRAETVVIEDWYEITEDGTHQFRPMWRTSAGTATAYNISSGPAIGEGLPIIFIAEVVPNPQ